MKKVISVFLAAALFVTLIGSQALAADDSPSDWAAQDVGLAEGVGLVPESMQSAYSQAVTRAEFCALAVALYENFEGEITGRVSFSDTDDVNVEKAASINVVNGIDESTFAPGNSLTREQAATMLSRLLTALGTPPEPQAAAFEDAADISGWALESVGHMQSSKIMGGVSETEFAPKGDYTRQQSIVTIWRTYLFSIKSVTDMELEYHNEYRWYMVQDKTYVDESSVLPDGISVYTSEDGTCYMPMNPDSSAESGISGSIVSTLALLNRDFEFTTEFAFAGLFSGSLTSIGKYDERIAGMTIKAIETDFGGGESLVTYEYSRNGKTLTSPVTNAGYSKIDSVQMIQRGDIWLVDINAFLEYFGYEGTVSVETNAGDVYFNIA